MKILDPETVISDCLETVFKLQTYSDIIEKVRKPDFAATPEFRKEYNGFYKLRLQKAEWYDFYFKLMEEQKIKEYTFEDLLNRMYTISHAIHVSFTSKLIATVDPGMPIWDRNVLNNLGLEERWKKDDVLPSDERIMKAAQIYQDIQKWYEDFTDSSDGKACIAAFDRALPKYREKISTVKKIDYLLWRKQ